VRRRPRRWVGQDHVVGGFDRLGEFGLQLGDVLVVELVGLAEPLVRGERAGLTDLVAELPEALFVTADLHRDLPGDQPALGRDAQRGAADTRDGVAQVEEVGGDVADGQPDPGQAAGDLAAEDVLSAGVGVAERGGVRGQTRFLVLSAPWEKTY
jgi:hypothetical protein